MPLSPLLLSFRGGFSPEEFAFSTFSAASLAPEETRTSPGDDENHENHFTRRNFLQTAAGAAGLALATKAIALPEPAYAQEWASGPNGATVQFGIIGIGMQGSGLLKTAVELPGTKCLAACDLWDGRQLLAKEIAGPTS